MTEPESDGNRTIDPATLAMWQLRLDPRMDGVPMRVEYPDGSTLTIDPPERGESKP